MALIRAEIKLPEMMRTVPVHLYYPTDLPPSVGNQVKGVITLLHGLSNTGADWFSMTAACRYAADNGYVLVAPDYGNSFGVNMAYGPAFGAILTQYLPAQLSSVFRLPTEREKNFICGNSMGGYAALRLAMAYPERYAAAGSFSGVVALSGETAKDLPGMRPFLEPVYGSPPKESGGTDLFALAGKTQALPEGSRPRLFATCGGQDNDITHILDQNRAFNAHCRALGLPLTYLEWDGVHEWNFWDRSLAEFMGFIGDGSYPRRKQADWAAQARPPESTP